MLILGWHYPSDVIGGMLIATAYGFAALAALAYLERNRPQPVMGPEARRNTRIGRQALEAVAVVLAVGAVLVLLPFSDQLVDYARSNTIASAVAIGIGAFSVTLLVALTALSRE